MAIAWAQQGVTFEDPVFGDVIETLQAHHQALERDLAIAEVARLYPRPSRPHGPPGGDGAGDGGNGSIGPEAKSTRGFGGLRVQDHQDTRSDGSGS